MKASIVNHIFAKNTIHYLMIIVYFNDNCHMIAVIKGDIIASRRIIDQDKWLVPLKSMLATWGNSPKDWKIERGDSFQIEVSSAELMHIILANPDITQEEIGKLLGIKQNSVSGRWNRANVNEILEVEEMFGSWRYRFDKITCSKRD